MSDNSRGLYRKYAVYRTDDDPTGKHADCYYFVLDLDHDAHAIAALEAYAVSCQDEMPLLARDLMKEVRSRGRTP